MPERPGADLHARDQQSIRVVTQRRVERGESVEPFERDEALRGKHRVVGDRTVALREEEAVAVGVVDRRRRHAQDPVVEHPEHVDRRIGCQVVLLVSGHPGHQHRQFGIAERGRLGSDRCGRDGVGSCHAVQGQTSSALEVKPCPAGKSRQDGIAPDQAHDGPPDDRRTGRAIRDSDVGPSLLRDGRADFGDPFRRRPPPIPTVDPPTCRIRARGTRDRPVDRRDPPIARDTAVRPDTHQSRLGPAVTQLAPSPR